MPMYVPASFKMTEPSDVLALMRANPFAALISHDAEGLTATHLPTVARQDGDKLVVECHIARGNPHWKRLAANPATDAMMIFTGPEAYIRPGWYPSKAEGGKVVPTWNYAIVHAYGRTEIIEDGAWLLRHVTELSAQQESPYEVQWKTSDAPEQYLAAMIRGIVGVRVSISRVDAKAKMGQNRETRDRLGAADGLAGRAQRFDLAVSDMMRTAGS
jgi:transcriptional regulator